jgi:hypothetical protein
MRQSLLGVITVGGVMLKYASGSGGRIATTYRGFGPLLDWGDFQRIASFKLVAEDAAIPPLPQGDGVSLPLKL